MANFTDPTNPVLTEDEQGHLERFIESVRTRYPNCGPMRPGDFGRAAGLTANEWIIAALCASALGLTEKVGHDEFGFDVIAPCNVSEAPRTVNSASNHTTSAADRAAGR